MDNSEKTLEKLVTLSKGRGFVYPGSEIYGGLANTWDYGPLGVELKENIKKAWRKKFIQENKYNVGLDSAILMNPQTWVASGHLGGVYTGTVAGITPRGVFVELDNTVEGFVPAAQLCKGEPQVIDGVSMLDPLTGKSWMLGSSMKIQVAAADVALGRIDFEYMVE